MGFLQKLRIAVWGRLAETQAERRLIVKLDWFILSFCCLMYWVNYLDRSNLNNAYVSGMKEDLKMYGTELNQINSVFYVGYTLAQVPNNIALQKLSPRIYFSTLMVCWGFFTLGNAFVTNTKQLFVIRFFQACMESATFVGTHYVLGSWYKFEELGKRTAIFIGAGIAGTMFSGILQGAVYRNLNGHRGLAGWRWLFIIDFIITMPVAIYGYIVFPGHPATTTSRYLSPTEKILAIERLPEVVQKRGVLGWSLLKRVGMSWEVYTLSILALLAGDSEMFADNAILNQYLKYLKTYSIEQINYIPTAVSGIAIVANLLFSWYADWFKSDDGRTHVGILLSITGLISGAIMLNPPSVNAKLFALFLNGVQLGFRSVLFAWANDICRKDDAKRAIVLGFMNAMTIAFYIFWTLCFYNTKQAPMWREGSIAMIANALAMFLSVLSVAWFSRRDKKREALIEDPTTSETASETVKVDIEESPKALDV